MTPADAQAFDQTWMTVDRQKVDRDEAEGAFRPDFPRAWNTGEVMEATVRMYDLTRDPRYLDHLRDLSRLVLDYRDDRRQDRVPSREDPFRGVVRVSVRDLLFAPGRQLVDGVSSGRGPHRPHRRAEGCG